MRHLLLIIVLFCTTFSFAQNKQFSLSGTLLSEEDNLPLESATIYLERVKDSTLVTYTISDKDGKFYIEDRTKDSHLNLYVSYVGYLTYIEKITLDKEEIILPPIILKPNTNQLDEIIIKSRAPVTIKKDTLEFNAKSFKTKKDANVEDLLKQLPGVEVDSEGKITVNGKPVNKILVNGKPFFGDDPTITTRNLSKEIIEKVQVTDTKTKSEAFSGEEGDKDNKTINLTISEDKNKGVFGRVAAGGGTDKRYEYAGMVNVFNNDQRISVLAGGNNTNSPGFSFGEIQKMFGNGRSMTMNSSGSFSIDGRSFGMGEGIVTSNTVGANYADEYGEGFDVNTDYFYSGSNSENESASQRENILPDSRYFTNSSSKSDNRNDAQTVNLGFDIKIDSTFLINIEPTFSYNKSNTNYTSNEESLSESNELINQSTSASNVVSVGKNFRNRLNITKRFGNRGAFFKFGMTNEFNNSNSDDFLDSETVTFGDNPSELSRNQYTDGAQSLNSFFSNVTYRLPIISKKLFLDFKYSLRDDKRESRKNTFDFNENTQEYTLFNEQLSTDFIYKNMRATPGLAVRYQKEKWSLNVNAGYVFRTLKNQDVLRPDLSLKRNFEALEFGSYFNITFSPKMSLYTGYSKNNTPPQLSQLQPFEDVSDPLNSITGNPDLEPSNNHALYMGFNNYDFQKGTGLFAYVNMDFVENQAVSKTTVDEDLIRNTTYTNVDGNYRMNISTSFSKKVKIDTLRTLKVRTGIYGNMSKVINFNNDVKYASLNTSITPNVRITFNWNDVLEITPRYFVDFSKTRFDIDAFKTQNFVRHSAGVKTKTFLPKKLEWQNDISYVFNPNVADGFQKSTWFWNASLAYSVLKDTGTLTFKVYDLLDQNTNAERTATADYIQDSQSTVLQQYFMLSFSWKFNSLGKKADSNDGNMFMIID